MINNSAEKLLARWKEMARIRRDASNRYRELGNIKESLNFTMSYNAYERCISELETALRGVDVPEPGTQWIEAEKLQNEE